MDVAVLRRVGGRYAVHAPIGVGGMASVYLGRVLGAGGFSRVVAIKQMHPHLAADPDFVRMFCDEARLAGRIRHLNVVPTLDVVAAEGELLHIMEYVAGVSLHDLFREAGGKVPVSIASAIMVDVLRGLHAAHTAKDEHGRPLGLVHRDVSPHNVLVGVDGTARLIDFGVAKAAGRLHTTRDGRVRGKLRYMSPEQLSGGAVTAASDLWSAGIVLWELSTGRRWIESESEGQIVQSVLAGMIEPPSRLVPDLPSALEAVVLAALEPLPSRRPSDALSMASALEAALRIARAPEVSEWVSRICGDELARRAALVREAELAEVTLSADPAESRPGEPANDQKTVAARARAPLSEGHTRIRWLDDLTLEVVYTGFLGVDEMERSWADQLAALRSRRARFRLVDASGLRGYDPAIGPRLAEFRKQCRALGVEEELHVESPAPLVQMRAMTAAMSSNTTQRLFRSRDEALAYVRDRSSKG